VLGYLGEGAFGTVVKMHFQKANTEMAVKVSQIQNLKAMIYFLFDICFDRKFL